MAELMKNTAGARLDDDFMDQAVAEARKGFGLVSPNPLVGALLERSGRIVGRGFHAGAGLPHAEVNAVRDALEHGEVCDGATLYVTLEPCSSFGRTPPCTGLIRQSRIRRVVIGSLDPNPKHSGRAVEILKNAGIAVSVLDDDRCKRLNAPFFHWVSTQRPLVALKLAATLDGRIATAGGESKWITGEVARQRVQMLRRAADAILVGAQTVRHDRPALTARDATGQVFVRTPRKFVASAGMTEKDLRVIYGRDDDLPEIVDLRTPEKWDDFLTRLGDEGMNLLLVEGGGELASSALDAGAVDILEYHIAPKILGGRNALPSVGGADAPGLGAARHLEFLPVLEAGGDLIVRARVLNAKHAGEYDVYWYN